ncbi:hypothetical protein BDN70DRAFT_882053 [Pholiota conissans]|uniref:DUF4145 domain-containing protein n=1 Tax=Pholiota conissans TaxID=109636 RepID=A0A9P5YX17_9AGAR|nr:hypothetical protein BDN70DRAFT_882053 [Pholiota conissans]
MLVLLKLKDDNPMMNRVLKETSKHRGDAQDSGISTPKPTATTYPDYVSLLAVVEEMKKDMVTRDEEVKTQHRATQERLDTSEENHRTTEENLKATKKSLEERLKVAEERLKATEDSAEERAIAGDKKIADLEAEKIRLEGRYEQKADELITAIAELTRLVNHFNPLLLRILVDKARQKVLAECSKKTWRELYEEQGNEIALQQYIQRVIVIPDEVAKFISKPSSTLREDGNVAAHHAESRDVLEAVERITRPVLRDSLECTFRWVYSQEDSDEI